MRFLHLGDLHLGKVVNGFSLLEDQRVALEHLLEDAEEHGVDALVLAGDLYDSSQPSAMAVRVLSDFLTNAASSGFEIFAIAGNHDSAERVGYTSGLLGRQGVHVAGPFDGTLSPHVVEDDYGRINVWLLPFLRPADVRAAYPNDTSIGADFTSAIGAVIKRMPLDESERNLLVAHQFVTCSAGDPQTCDSETVWVGTAGNVDAQVFSCFDYVALGHLHRPQAVGRSTVRYAGSLLKYSYSEIKGAKSGVLVEMGPKGTVTTDLLPVRAPRDLREIQGELEELLAKGRREEENTDDYIHAVLTDEELPLHALHRLREVYPHLMGIDQRNARTQKDSHLEALSFALDDMNPLELFCQFFAEQNGRALTNEEDSVVRDVLNALQACDEEGI